MSKTMNKSSVLPGWPLMVLFSRLLTMRQFVNYDHPVNKAYKQSYADKNDQIRSKESHDKGKGVI